MVLVSKELPADIRALLDQLAANDRSANSIIDGLSAVQGTWRPAPGSWCVSECLDHLATSGRVYLDAMQGTASIGRARGRTRTRPARPGWIGRAFVNMLEPPPKWWSRLQSPSKIRPLTAPPLAPALAHFLESQANVRTFIHATADLDLATLLFPNPFVSGIRFSLATGLHVITAHNRRHLLQAQRVRQALEMAVVGDRATG